MGVALSGQEPLLNQHSLIIQYSNYSAVIQRCLGK
jgi:hypothetical protein